ncbi:hypothetical protein BJJ97_05820 [Pectobacterium polaris]|nr:hypothetical protein BJJ97_05820 [Pectobacterium polaris]
MEFFFKKFNGKVLDKDILLCFMNFLAFLMKITELSLTFIIPMLLLIFFLTEEIFSSTQTM